MNNTLRLLDDKQELGNFFNVLAEYQRIWYPVNAQRGKKYIPMPKVRELLCPRAHMNRNDLDVMLGIMENLGLIRRLPRKGVMVRI